MTDHRALAGGYFNAAWDLIDARERTPAQDRDLMTLTFASRQHWVDAGGSEENLIVADWQIAYAASLSGLSYVALVFAEAAVERAESADVPAWLKASAHEGLARANAAAGNDAGYAREVATARALLDSVDDDSENRKLIESQLASIPTPR
jgi:replication-associated recombination protein RarA